MSDELTDVEFLKKYQLTLQNNLRHLNCEQVFERFPFSELVNVSKFNSEVISLLIDVLFSFIQLDAFYDHRDFVDFVINFYTHHLSSTNDANDASCNLVQSISDVCLLFDKGAQLRKRFVVTGRLLKAVSDLVASADGTEYMKNVYKILRLFLEHHDIECEANELEECIAIIWSAQSFDPERLQLTNAMITYATPSRIPVILDAYKTFIKYFPDVHSSQMKVESLNALLSICVRIYQTCDNQCVLKELSIRLIECNLLESLFMPTLSKQYTWKILAQQIKVLFAPHDWNSDVCEGNSLEQAIDEYVSRKDTDNAMDLTLIIVYLDFMYKNLGNVKTFNHAIVANLVEKYRNRQPAQKPAFKSLLLLFALYCTLQMTNESNYSQFDLLSQIQLQRDVTSFLTLHVSQFFWILTQAHPSMKMRTLHFWLEQYANDAHLVAYIKDAKQIDVLCDFIARTEYSTPPHIRQRAVNILAMFGEPEETKNRLMQLLLRPDLDRSTILMLLKGNPNVPVINADSESKEMARFLIKRFTFLYSHRILVEHVGQKHIAAYLFKLLRATVPQDKDLLVEVFSSNLLPFLAVDLQTNENEMHIKFAAKIFCMILHSQWTLNVDAATCVPISGKLNLDNEWICRLMHTLMRSNYGRTKYAVGIRDPLELHYSMLAYLTSRHGTLAQQYIRRLIREERKVACAVINIIAIDKFCRSNTLNPPFVQYLVDWIAVLDMYPFLKAQVPWKELSRYVQYLDNRQYSHTDYAVLKKVVAENAPDAQEVSSL